MSQRDSSVLTVKCLVIHLLSSEERRDYIWGILPASPKSNLPCILFLAVGLSQLEIQRISGVLKIVSCWIFKALDIVFGWLVLVSG